MKSNFRSAFSPRVPVVVDFPDRQFAAKQSFASECDINNIMARFTRTGVLDWLAQSEPRFGDFTGFDFQRNMNMLSEAQEIFAGLPARLRARFENDASQFFEFMGDPANLDEAIELGLVKPGPAAQDGAPASDAPASSPKRAKGKASAQDALASDPRQMSILEDAEGSGAEPQVKPQSS